MNDDRQYVLESRDITKAFLSNVAVNKMTLRLETGKVYAMLGPNGSGKTTWMKMASGLIKPTSGQMLYNGKPIGVESKKDVAYASTEPYFYSWMSVKDVGKYYQDFFADFSMERYQLMLNRMELQEGMKIRKLSTGMMAKMKVAVTMARKAKVFLLDEPLNGIDIIARDAITKTIFETVDPSVTMVISSHMVEDLERLADYAVLMKKGELIGIYKVSDLEAKGGNLADLYRSTYREGGTE